MDISFWKLLAGLAVFLFGMEQLERGIEHLAGRSFKLFIKKYTTHPFSAVLVGILITAILQSSSLVSFIVLAFVGAGVMAMPNALSVILGANFGTTLTSWIIALVGFSFNLEKFSYPILACGGIVFLVFGSSKSGFNYARMIIGFGMLFLGLDFMKASIGDYFSNFDVSPYVNYPIIVFALLGFIITAIVQASSATMAIALSALYTGKIPLEIAAGLIIGSELGTSIKSWFGAMQGLPAKKQVALGNILFNSGTTLMGLILVHPILYLITKVWNVSDEVYALVLFQNFTNLATIVMFFPFLQSFSSFLERRFREKKDQVPLYISKTGTEIPEAALDALEKDAHFFLHKTIVLNLDAFHIERNLIPLEPELSEKMKMLEGSAFSYGKFYDQLKVNEGEIVHYYLDLNKESLNEKDSRRLQQLLNVIRNATFSAKAMKDIRSDRKDFRESADDRKHEQYKKFQDKVKSFYLRVGEILQLKDKQVVFNDLTLLLESIRKEYDTNTAELYGIARNHQLSEQDLSTLLNVNRELFSSHRSLIHAIKDLMLSAESASNFESLPSVKN